MQRICVPLDAEREVWVRPHLSKRDALALEDERKAPGWSGADEGAFLVERCVTAWNLTDEHGNAIACTPDAVAGQLSLRDYTKVARTLMAAVGVIDGDV